MLLAKSVPCIKKHIQEIGVLYNANIHKQHLKAPCLLDKNAFTKLKHLLMWYFLGKL